VQLVQIFAHHEYKRAQLGLILSEILVGLTVTKRRLIYRTLHHDQQEHLISSQIFLKNISYEYYCSND